MVPLKLLPDPNTFWRSTGINYCSSVVYIKVAGLNQAEKNRNFQFDVSTLDAMILSHAHIDHCGNLPNLIRNGYTGPIYATSATKDLADLLVRDSAHIQEADAEYINKKNARKGLPPVEPLYTISDAARVNQYILPVEYGVEFDVIPGVKARLVDAGHILGSAAVVLDINEQGKKTKLWFSGDIGRPGLPLVRDPVQPEDGIDLMMMECTYGDKSHENPEKAFEELKTCHPEDVCQTWKNNYSSFRGWPYPGIGICIE